PLADNFARLANRTERPFRLNQIPYNLTDATTPSQRGAGLKIVSVGGQEGAIHPITGLNARRSKKPCSTSFNCVFKPKLAMPSSVSSTQSRSLSPASSATSTRATLDCPAKYSLHRCTRAG